MIITNYQRRRGRRDAVIVSRKFLLLTYDYPLITLFYEFFINHQIDRYPITVISFVRFCRVVNIVRSELYRTNKTKRFLVPPNNRYRLMPLKVFRIQTRIDFLGQCPPVKEIESLKSD